NCPGGAKGNLGEPAGLAPARPAGVQCRRRDTADSRAQQPGRVRLADKLTPLILDALGRAALAPHGTPLVGTRSVPGLFPATNPGRQAAKRACDDGLLAKVLSDPPVGRRELVAATEKGLQFLIEQSNPKQVLEDLVRAVEARHEQVAGLIDTARQMQVGLDAI